MDKNIIALIVILMREKSYSPSQILAVSFDRWKVYIIGTEKVYSLSKRVFLNSYTAIEAKLK
jgi:hypothetical protein